MFVPIGINGWMAHSRLEYLLLNSFKLTNFLASILQLITSKSMMCLSNSSNNAVKHYKNLCNYCFLIEKKFTSHSNGFPLISKRDGFVELNWTTGSELFLKSILKVGIEYFNRWVLNNVKNWVFLNYVYNRILKFHKILIIVQNISDYLYLTKLNLINKFIYVFGFIVKIFPKFNFIH